MSDSVVAIAIVLEALLLLCGVVLLWRLIYSPAARARPAPALLPPWEATPAEVLMFLFLILFGATGAAFIASGWAGRLGLAGDAVTIFNGAAFQLGMLAGIAACYFTSRRSQRGRDAGPATGPGVLVSGVATFLISLPLLTVTSLVWEQVLELCGMPAERQDLIEMFANVDSPALLAMLITLAIGTAPVAEELVFRAGMFRYFRTRLPRPIAFLAPAFLFAALHVNWDTMEGLASVGPLVMLSIIFSLAYERTGRIGTSILAHALFNLHTIMLIFAGVGL